MIIKDIFKAIQKKLLIQNQTISWKASAANFILDISDPVIIPFILGFGNGYVIPYRGCKGFRRQ